MTAVVRQVRHRMAAWGALALAGVLATTTAMADVRVPAVFGNHMVLQREQEVPVWGWADPGEKVTVTFRDQEKTATADNSGRWMLRLDPLQVGEPGKFTVKGNNTLTFEDVLVGEVWVCSGQSNMGWTVNASIDPDLEAAAAKYPNLRLFQVPLTSKPEPQDDVKAEWKATTPETIPNFSGVAYFFGRQLHQVLGVPVGLIQTAWGGTRAEAWTSPEAMAGTNDLRPILESWEQQAAAYQPEAAQAQYEKALARWEEQAAKARAEKKPVPRRLQPPTDPRLSQHHPSNLWNAMVAPLVPYAIRGAIWYQGESNASRAHQYRTLMPTMITSWRKAWNQGDFPFYQVQLANFRAIQPEPGDSDWAELREAQMLTTEALPNVGAACITDLGAALDIHPKNKQDVGKRLARLALVDIYGYAGKMARHGPTYKSVDFQGNKAVVHFDTGGSSLNTWYNEPLTGFAIAGEDRKWVWGTAKITGKDTVEIVSDQVPEPVAIRYNWSDNPQGNLYNAQYLPAYPFRTDDWPCITEANVTP